MASNYFATRSREELGTSLIDWVRKYDQYILTTGRLGLWRSSYSLYYLSDLLRGSLVRTGDVGQYLNVNTNHFKSILQSILSVTTSQRPAWQPKAINSSFKSQAQASVATSVLDYFFFQKKLERFPKRAAEFAITMAEGFVGIEWDPSLGEPYQATTDMAQIAFTGDVSVSAYNPIDVIRDFSVSSFADCEWTITRKYLNKWNLAARFQQAKDKIIAQSIQSKQQMYRLGHPLTERTDDTIAFYCFYHKKTTLMPKGKLAYFLDDGTIVLEGDLPYQNVPIHRIVHTEKMNTTFGHTIAYDLIPKQIEYDKIASIILTNQAKFGIPNISAPVGSNMTQEMIGGGVKFISYPQGVNKPEVMNLLNTQPEIFKRLEDIKNEMENIAGMPGLLRGQQPASVQSGTGMAYISSMALQFNSDFQQNWVSLLEDMGTSLVEILKRFAVAPRMIPIVGAASAYKLKSFNADEISDVDRVQVEVVSPLPKTIAGRLQIADSLLQKGLITERQDYITLITTGNFDALVEDTETDNLNVKRENEVLMNGGNVNVLNTDNHPYHIDKHLACLDDPDIRNDAQKLHAILDHCLAHQAAWHLATQTMPDFLVARHIPPAPSAPPPQPLPGPMPPEGLPMPPGPSQQPQNGQPGSQMPNMPAGPQGTPLPGNPQAGQAFNPQTPGQQKVAAVRPPQGPKPPKGMPPEQGQAFQQQSQLPRP